MLHACIFSVRLNSKCKKKQKHLRSTIYATYHKQIIIKRVVYFVPQLVFTNFEIPGVGLSESVKHIWGYWHVSYFLPYDFDSRCLE